MGRWQRVETKYGKRKYGDAAAAAAVATAGVCRLSALALLQSAATPATHEHAALRINCHENAGAAITCTYAQPTSGLCFRPAAGSNGRAEA